MANQITLEQLRAKKAAMTGTAGMVSTWVDPLDFEELQLAILNSPAFEQVEDKTILVHKAPIGAQFMIGDPERTRAEKNRMKRRGIKQPRKVVVGYDSGDVWWTNIPPIDLPDEELDEELDEEPLAE